MLRCMLFRQPAAHFSRLYFTLFKLLFHSFSWNVMLCFFRCLFLVDIFMSAKSHFMRCCLCHFELGLCAACQHIRQAKLGKCPREHDFQFGSDTRRDCICNRSDGNEPCIDFGCCWIFAKEKKVIKQWRLGRVVWEPLSAIHNPQRLPGSFQRWKHSKPVAAKKPDEKPFVASLSFAECYSKPVSQRNWT